MENILLPCIGFNYHHHHHHYYQVLLTDYDPGSLTLLNENAILNANCEQIATGEVKVEHLEVVTLYMYYNWIKVYLLLTCYQSLI